MRQNVIEVLFQRLLSTSLVMLKSLFMIGDTLVIYFLKGLISRSSGLCCFGGFLGGFFYRYIVLIMLLL